LNLRKPLHVDQSQSLPAGLTISRAGALQFQCQALAAHFNIRFVMTEIALGLDGAQPNDGCRLLPYHYANEISRSGSR
jgi:hypothetical protein